MYDGNPGDIDFGSNSARFDRVSEGSSYRESTVPPFLSFISLFEPLLFVSR